MRVPNVEVFRTNIRSARHATVVIGFVQTYFPGLRATVDLQDRDKVLRVEDRRQAEPVPGEAIRRLVNGLGFEIEVMEE